MWLFKVFYVPDDVDNKHLWLAQRETVSLDSPRSSIFPELKPRETLKPRESKTHCFPGGQSFSVLFYYIYTEIYTLKSRRINFRSQTDVNQSNVAYRFSHMWEKRYVQSGAACHVFSRVSRTASWRFHSRPVGAVSCTSHRFASLKRANSFYSHFFHR